MIIRKKLDDGKRSASAWIEDCCICFGVTDYNPALGWIESDDGGNVVLTINKKNCGNANVKINILEEE